MALYAVTETGKATWASLEQSHAMHAWPDDLVNTIFRNEGAGLSSDLIVEAMAATAWCWPSGPSGLITFIDPAKLRSTNPGCCFKAAGFRLVGQTIGAHKGRADLLVLRLDRSAWPAPEPPLNAQLSLLEHA